MNYILSCNCLPFLKKKKFLLDEPEQEPKANTIEINHAIEKQRQIKNFIKEIDDIMINNTNIIVRLKNSI